MKNLFANVSYTFNNFYNNLNIHGQIIFSVIILLILVLCILLFITYLIQEFKSKMRIKKIRKSIKNENKQKVLIDDVKKEEVINSEVLNANSNIENDISDIAKRVEDAINEKRPIDLTNFEEDQERTAIISIDELMKRAKELEIIEDEETGINYLEKYNLEPSEINSEVKDEKSDPKLEVKAFKVSQVISPVYGIKKEAIESNNNN